MAEARRARCRSELDTRALGERIGTRLRTGDLVALTGPLGSGKTVLARGIATGTGADPRAVRSPTFVLHQVYPGARVTLHHLDLYRLGAGADVTFLDIDGLLVNGAVVVEWAELAPLPHSAPARVTLEINGDGSRLITLLTGGATSIDAAWDVPENAA